MTKLALMCAAVFTGAVIANFAYQWLHRRYWDVAAERSYFQGVVLLALWLVAWSNS